MKVGYISRQNENFILHKRFPSYWVWGFGFAFIKNPRKAKFIQPSLWQPPLLYDSPVLISCLWTADFLK